MSNLQNRQVDESKPEGKFCSICLEAGKKLHEVERLLLCYKCKARVKAGLRSKTYHNK
jgi:hypothetical protein